MLLTKNVVSSEYTCEWPVMKRHVFWPQNGAVANLSAGLLAHVNEPDPEPLVQMTLHTHTLHTASE